MRARVWGCAGALTAGRCVRAALASLTPPACVLCHPACTAIINSHVSYASPHLQGVTVTPFRVVDEINQGELGLGR